MSLTIREQIPPIEGLTVPIDLPAEHLDTIRATVAKVAELTARASACNPVALNQFAREVFQRHARGEIDLAQAVAIAAICGHSDLQRREISEKLVSAILVEEQAARASASPAVISAFQLKTDELRRRTAAIEAREQEDSELAGIDYQPSETAKRMRSTFEHSLERLRALRDRGELPSKAELRSLAE
jgi:hypothetical protein